MCVGTWTWTWVSRPAAYRLAAGIRSLSAHLIGSRKESAQLCESWTLLIFGNHSITILLLPLCPQLRIYCAACFDSRFMLYSLEGYRNRWEAALVVPAPYMSVFHFKLCRRCRRGVDACSYFCGASCIFLLIRLSGRG